MKYKKYLGIAISMVVIALASTTSIVSFTGCGTLGGGGTNAVDQAAIDRTAILLRSAARDGTLVAITAPNGQDANRIYFQLAADAIGVFATGKDFSPAAFQTAILKVIPPTDPALNMWVQIGLGTVIDLYQLYFGEYVRNSVAKEAIAKQFLIAVQDGFNEALGRPVSAKKPKASKPGNILPRPIR